MIPVTCEVSAEGPYRCTVVRVRSFAREVCPGVCPALELESDHIVGLQEAERSLRRIVCQIGRADTTKPRCWWQWVEEGMRQRHEGSGRDLHEPQRERTDRRSDMLGVTQQPFHNGGEWNQTSTSKSPLTERSYCYMQWL